MGHVSRTHRVALDCLFVKIHLDPRIQIKFVDTKNQLADMWTKGKFHRDEWKHLFRLLNIMNDCMFSCSHCNQIDDPRAMSKRQMQEEKPGVEERVVPKSKPSAFSSSKAPLKAQSSHSDRTCSGARGLNENTAWFSRVAFGGKHGHQYGQTRRGNDKENHWYDVISPQLWDLWWQCDLETVHSNVRQKLNRPKGDTHDIDVDAMICGIFMSATVKAAVHLGQDHQENLRTTKNTDFEKVIQLFDNSQKLILNQLEEIFGISTIEWSTIPWMRTTLPHDRANKFLNAKVHVNSDSVLRVAKIHEHPQSIDHWKGQNEWFMIFSWKAWIERNRWRTSRVQLG